MKLTELSPQFLRYDPRPDGIHLLHVEKFADAQGIVFKCPKCYAANKGPVGTHSVICWSKSRGVPDEAPPGPGRWALEGTSYSDLTLGCEPGKSRSVLLTGPGCGWHGFVTNGEAA